MYLMLLKSEPFTAYNLTAKLTRDTGSVGRVSTNIFFLEEGG